MDKDQKGIEVRGADRALAAIAEPSQDTSGKYTVQVEHSVVHICTVTVEADSIEHACELAVEEADDNGCWTSVDEPSESWVGMIRNGVHDSAWPDSNEDEPSIPIEFTETATVFGRKTARASELYDALKSIIDYAESDVVSMFEQADIDEGLGLDRAGSHASAVAAQQQIDKARALLAELAD